MKEKGDKKTVLKGLLECPWEYISQKSYKACFDSITKEILNIPVKSNAFIPDYRLIADNILQKGKEHIDHDYVGCFHAHTTLSLPLQQ